MALRKMNTIIIKADCRCKEFGVNHDQADPFVLGIDFEERIVVIHHKSTKFWSGMGESSTAPAEIQVIRFDEWDVGTQISDDRGSIFLRGTTLLMEECAPTRAKAKEATQVCITNTILEKKSETI